MGFRGADRDVREGHDHGSAGGAERFLNNVAAQVEFGLIHATFVSRRVG
jgi:hypothetical protein